MEKLMTLDLKTLRDAVAGTAAAFRCVTDYQPAGGPGDKVFPPTYEGGKYATEKRIDPKTRERKPCVLLDSVQSQANRMELALLEAHRAGRVTLPLIVTQFDLEDPHKYRNFTVTSLEAPHRAADALFRDSRLNGVMFRESDKGRLLDTADIRNATGLFGLCPTALVFGLWDSTGPRGGLGAKFQRALVSEIVGYDVEPGVETASRIDPAQIMRVPDVTLYQRSAVRDDAPDWTLSEKEGSGPLGTGPRRGRPSQANHGNVTPDYAFARDQRRQIIYDTVSHPDGREVRKPRIVGGFTISKATQTTVLSFAALRRLRFPLGGAADSDHETDVSARTALAALGIAAGTLARDDMNLRSRCQLFAETAPTWELLDRPAETPKAFDIDGGAVLQLLTDAVEQAKRAGLPWEGEIELTPSEDLVKLVRRSQELASQEGTEQN